MSEIADDDALIARLERRLARERSARLQAEVIAERVTADRWEIREKLEGQLALRTSELEAARRVASEAITERQQCRATMSHALRTSLTALLYLSESLSEDAPITAPQLEEFRNRLRDMHDALDAAASASTAVAPDTGRDATDAGSAPRTPLGDIVSAHEDAWQQLAARSGKLLILDVDTASRQSRAGTAVEVNKAVLDLIRKRVDADDPVIELHMTVGPGGLTLV